MTTDNAVLSLHDLRNLDGHIDLDGQVEVIDYSIYDTIVYPHDGEHKLDFFSVPCGLNGKSLVQTNLYNSHRLTNGSVFLLNGIALDFIGVYDHDLIINGYCEILVNNIIIATIAPLSMIMRDKIHDSNNYIPYRFTIPRVIRSDVNFSVECRWPGVIKTQSKDVETRIRVELCGLLYRRVQ